MADLQTQTDKVLAAWNRMPTPLKASTYDRATAAARALKVELPGEFECGRMFDLECEGMTPVFMARWLIGTLHGMGALPPESTGWQLTDATLTAMDHTHLRGHAVAYATLVPSDLYLEELAARIAFKTGENADDVLDNVLDEALQRLLG